MAKCCGYRGFGVVFLVVLGWFGLVLPCLGAGFGLGLVWAWVGLCGFLGLTFSCRVSVQLRAPLWFRSRVGLI